MLKKGGYKIKVLNTINFAKSMHYNPFAYIRSEKDILKLVNTIIVNTKGEGQQSGENFKNAVDLLFEELEAKDPNHFAVRQYKKYKLAAGVINFRRLLNQNKYRTATA